MKVTIDRFEGEFAVVELAEADNKTINMPIELLPSGAVEGDVVSITIDSDETQRRKQHIQDMMNTLFKN